MAVNGKPVDPWRGIARAGMAQGIRVVELVGQQPQVEPVDVLVERSDREEPEVDVDTLVGLDRLPCTIGIETDSVLIGEDGISVGRVQCHGGDVGERARAVEPVSGHDQVDAVCAGPVVPHHEGFQRLVDHLQGGRPP